ncbi:MAG TPA: hypothetical protein DCK93_06540, partial [Blastocatellia bacterium]|nr:hypothetical protein [Blastocatellia bacterium]
VLCGDVAGDLTPPAFTFPSFDTALKGRATLTRRYATQKDKRRRKYRMSLCGPSRILGTLAWKRSQRLQIFI